MKIKNELICSFINNKNLIYQLTKRDVLSRYKGSVIGIAWSVITPLLMLMLYTFVFSFVFKARWGGAIELPREMYALILYTGMIFHSLLCECINRSPTLMQSNASYVKKVIFPLEILNWVSLFSALFQAMIGFTLLIFGKVIITGEFTATIFILPFLLIPFVLIVLGVCWFIISVGVYFRDISHLTSILTTVLMFASPIFYPISILPSDLQFIMYLNPLTYFIEEARNVLIFGAYPDFRNYVFVLILSIFVAAFGFSFFQKTRKGFADVL